jgi:Uma2 family endonuclease
MSATATKHYTAEEFLRLPDPPDGSKQELVQGEIVAMPPPHFDHGEVQLAIGSLLRAFVRKHKIGRVTTESGLITDRSPDSVRGPDVAFWSKEQIPLDQKVEGYPDAVADLCVEVVSEKKRRAALKRKLTEYFKRGVRLVWVADTEAQTVTIYRTPKQGKVIMDDGSLDGEDVLPGFQCSLSDIFTN